MCLPRNLIAFHFPFHPLTKFWVFTARVGQSLGLRCLGSDGSYEPQVGSWILGFI